MDHGKNSSSSGRERLVAGYILVTRNTADFEGMGIALFNPWLAAGS